MKNKIMICSPYLEMMVYGPKIKKSHNSCKRRVPKRQAMIKVNLQSLDTIKPTITRGMRQRKVCSFWDPINKQVRSWYILGQTWSGSLQEHYFWKVGWLNPHRYFSPFPGMVDKALLFRDTEKKRAEHIYCPVTFTLLWWESMKCQTAKEKEVHNKIIVLLPLTRTNWVYGDLWDQSAMPHKIKNARPNYL